MRWEISSVSTFPTSRGRRSRGKHHSLSIAVDLASDSSLLTRRCAISRLIMTRPESSIERTRHVRSENLFVAGRDFLWSRTNIASNHARDDDARSRIWHEYWIWRWNISTSRISEHTHRPILHKHELEEMRVKVTKEIIRNIGTVKSWELEKHYTPIFLSRD